MPRDGGRFVGDDEAGPWSHDEIDTAWLKEQANAAQSAGDRELCVLLTKALFLHLGEGLTVPQALSRA